MTTAELLVILGTGIVLGVFAVSWIRANSKKTTSGKGGGTGGGDVDDRPDGSGDGSTTIKP